MTYLHKKKTALMEDLKKKEEGGAIKDTHPPENTEIMSEEKAYRIRARRFMLTYNSVHAHKEELCAKIREGLKKEVTYVAIAWEIGKKSERKHTHVIVECVDRLDQNTKCVTWEGIHPRVDAAKSMKHWTNMVQYMDKEDEEVYVWGETSTQEAKEAKKELTGADVLAYENVAEAIRECGVRYATQIKCVWEVAKEEEYTCEELKEHPWQTQLADTLADMKDRSIVWVYDKVGGTGKSTWAQHQHILKRALYIGHLGKVSDFIEALYNAKDEWDNEYIIIDLTRQQESGCSIYACIEAAAKRVMTRQKYTSKTFVLKKQPKICVLANWPPEVKELSMDRWRIYEVDAGALTLGYRPPNMFQRTMHNWEEDGWIAE